MTQTAVLYRPTDRETPVSDRLLWYPETKTTVGADGQGKWLYAVDCPTNLLVTIHSDSKILSREWVSAPKGMNTLTVSLPDGTDSAVMEIAVTGNYRTSNCRIEINRDVTAKGIRFITESFRDHLVPARRRHGPSVWSTNRAKAGNRQSCSTCITPLSTPSQAARGHSLP